MALSWIAGKDIMGAYGIYSRTVNESLQVVRYVVETVLSSIYSTRKHVSANQANDCVEIRPL